jgi:hypothetical protein
MYNELWAVQDIGTFVSIYVIRKIFLRKAEQSFVAQEKSAIML